MGHRAVVISAPRYAEEGQLGNAELTVPGVAAGDQVVLVADTEPPVVFGFGRATRAGSVRYTRRLFDTPLPAAGLADGPLTPEAFAELVAQAGPGAPTRSWLVGVDLPIEADSPAEAVRRYWSYLHELGPTELPAFVAPVGDELAMQPYLLGAAAPFDPEDDQAG